MLSNYHDDDIERLVASLTEVTLPDPENFLKIRETLSRIGMAPSKDKVLYQSCHILHKRGKYYIVHFKQLFLLDGKKADYSEDDIARLNTIVNLLDEWGLVKIVNPEKTKEPLAPLSKIKIVAHKDKPNWMLVAKYTIGSKKH